MHCCIVFADMLLDLKLGHLLIQVDLCHMNGEVLTICENMSPMANFSLSMCGKSPYMKFI
jgi:hypothetical protein